jgi:hypothetical protein
MTLVFCLLWDPKNSQLLYLGPDDSPTRTDLASLLVKHAGLALPDPTVSAKSNYDASTLVVSHLLAALRVRGVDHP